MSPFEKTYATEQDDGLEWKVAQLPIVDNGYYDTLAAIGFGALAHSYYDTPKSPLIEWTSNGFQIYYVDNLRTKPDLQWLKYSVAGEWRKSGLETGITKKDGGWDGEIRIKTNNSEVDVSKSDKITIQIRGKERKINDPERTLYSVINDLGNPTWFNLCIYACKQKGIDILNKNFEEEKIPFNKIVFPLGSKGANSSNSFSISNSKISVTKSRSVGWLTCLAAAGLAYSAIGQSSNGFAVPMPLKMRVETLGNLVSRNRRRYVNWGFFFPFDNYLSFLKLLLIHAEGFELKLGETPKLKGVTGAKFIELGNSASPSGIWHLMVPRHSYSVGSVEDLQSMLVNWRKVVTPKKGAEPSINRKAVFDLMKGFETSDPAFLASGYLNFSDDSGFIKKDKNGKSKLTFYPLKQNLFEEIMEHSDKYNKLLKEFKSEEIQRFINLIRDETFKKVFNSSDKKSEQPNYKMMRKLREVQTSDDFITAITEISVERGTNKLASEMTEKNDMKHMVMPYNESLNKLISLAEDERYTPRTISQLLLAFALSSQKSKGEN